MSRPNTPTDKTKNWPSYNEALQRRSSLTIWFDPETRWDADPAGKRGRQPAYSAAAVQSCLTMKVLFGMALRQTKGVVESLLRLVGLDWDVPDFSTLSRRQKTLAVNIPFCGSNGPLHLLIDSTGIKVEGKGAWNAHKHGGPKRRVWRKVHLGIDEETLAVRAVAVTKSDADGTYDTRKCYDVIADCSAAAVISPRRNAKSWKAAAAGAVARNEAVRASKYLGRALWRKWRGYHRRSDVETKMHCVKLLGQRLMARDFDR